jgi:hypothetical protein
MEQANNTNGRENQANERTFTVEQFKGLLAVPLPPPYVAAWVNADRETARIMIAVRHLVIDPLPKI